MSAPRLHAYVLGDKNLVEEHLEIIGTQFFIEIGDLTIKKEHPNAVVLVLGAIYVRDEDMHESWRDRCFITVTTDGKPIQLNVHGNMRGSRRRRVALSTVLADVTECLTDQRCATVMRDSMRSLHDAISVEADKKITSTDDIVSRLLGKEPVTHVRPIKNIWLDRNLRTLVGATFIGARVVHDHGAADLAVYLSNVPDDLNISDPTAGVAEPGPALVVYLLFPTGDAWSSEKMAKLWDKVDSFNTPTIICLPPNADLTDTELIERMVTLAVQRGSSRRPRLLAASISACMAQIEEACSTLSLNAAAL